MLFLKKKIIAYAFLIVVVLTAGIASADIYIMDLLGENGLDKSNFILNKFSDEKFSHYLKDLTHYDLLEHKTAIQNLLIKYRKDYLEFENCFVRKSRKFEKEYSDKWLKELNKKFGKKYIVANYESIKELLVNLSMKHTVSFCIEDERQLLYSEIQYLLSLRGFCENFIKFYNSLNESEKKIYNDRKINAEEILKAASIYPMQVTLYGGRIGHHLSLQNRVNLSEDAFNFIVNHPQFLKPFRTVQAIIDLRELIETH